MEIARKFPTTNSKRRLFVIWKVGFVIGVVYLVFSISRLAGITLIFSGYKLQ